MSIIQEKYRRLAPRLELLHDVVILSQGWKKAHSYIRRHNWYADTLELDCSALGLDALLDTWSSELKAGDYRTMPVRLVPAPKNGAWIFSPERAGGWGPEKDDNFVLRPLAHVGVRDQTISTAIMLCLADCIETAQGDPSLSPEKAAKAGVFSYGNRLYCRWKPQKRRRSRAGFSWGNSDTYSRYFQDYQQFVERPSKLAQKIALDSPGKTIYIVKLDLKAFYDNIDLNRLVGCLRSEYARFRRGHVDLPESDNGFWDLVSRALNFQWAESDRSLKGLLRDDALPHGLPQGLVGSGFFANAYLLDFDREIGESLGSVWPFLRSGPVAIHDYCRYVDDLRLVISVDGPSPSQEELKAEITRWVQECLDRSIKVAPESSARLEISEEKTVIELFAAVGRQSGVAARMKSLQQQLSGPFDMATLQQVENGLDGLLALAELDFDGAEDPSDSNSELSLAAVARPKLEVRDDTLTRFSAYRLTKSLRLRRSMTDLTEQGDGGLAQETLKHEFEVAARRLVAAWARNPSLVQVLRYGLDIFPSEELLSSVLEALERQLATSNREKQRCVAYYVIAELLKAGAAETGWRAVDDANFQAGNIGQYRMRLTSFAKEVMGCADMPWYVLQQAVLFLATQRVTAEFPGQEEELKYHRQLADYVACTNTNRDSPAEDTVAVSLVGHQLLRNQAHYLKWFRGFAKNRPQKEIASALEIVSQNNSDLYSALTRPGRGGFSSARQELPAYLRFYASVNAEQDSVGLPRMEWLTLSNVFRHRTSLFSQENGLLRLAKGLGELFINVVEDPTEATPFSVEVKCQNWDLINNPNYTVESQLSVRLTHSKATGDPRYRTPDWCDSQFSWMYAIGRLLRAAATGELDFTTRQWILREETGRYVGIRSTWQKRRFGMMHAATALGGTTAPITPWFSELLLRLLQWPGIAADADLIPDFDSISSPADFVDFIEKRLQAQAAIYGASSGLPIYVYPVEWNLGKSSKLRVALVQGLMPSVADFVEHEGRLDESGYRAKHRNHTASLLNLLHRHIQAHDSISGRPHKPYVDLIVFPEYSIHPSDQDLIRALSDATGAMVFYGLAGTKDPVTGNLVNAARWLVPQRRGGRRSWVEVDQGKWHVTKLEEKYQIRSWRPYQVVIELRDGSGSTSHYRIAGAICYDATDISLAADLRDVSHMFVVAAMNKDVKTFDSMVSALRYHMYQHILIANSGEFGGSTAQAPYDKEHKRLLSHVHGNEQIAISLFEVEMDHFGPKLFAAQSGESASELPRERIGKTPPAGLKRNSAGGA